MYVCPILIFVFDPDQVQINGLFMSKRVIMGCRFYSTGIEKIKVILLTVVFSADVRVPLFYAHAV